MGFITYTDEGRVNATIMKAERPGLGLPIARRIVRDHGGDIHYFPRDGGGSVFQIRLPLDEKRQP